MTKPIGVRIGELVGAEMKQQRAQRPDQNAEILGEMMVTLICSSISIPAYLLGKKEKLDEPETHKLIIDMASAITRRLDAHGDIKPPKLS